MNRKSFIDVDEFILRLEWLKEWMALTIDRKERENWVIGIWERTGMIVSITRTWDGWPIPQLETNSSFDQYCKYKQLL